MSLLNRVRMDDALLKIRAISLLTAPHASDAMVAKYMEVSRLRVA